MRDFEPLLAIEDIMRIFKLSRVSVQRRLQKARAGRGGLPLPIPSERKQSLRWCPETVRHFLQNTSTPQTPPTLTIESEKSRQKRHAAAMKTLERFGIKTKTQD